MRFWNDETDAVLRKLWGLGQTASKIGARLGVSRNSVIGRAHRLNLSKRGNPVANQRVRSLDAARAAKPKRIPKPKPTKPAAVVRLPQPRAIASVNRPSPYSTCQYIAGTGRPWTKCGEPTVQGHSWCQAHCAVVYQPREQKVAAE